MKFEIKWEWDPGIIQSLYPIYKGGVSPFTPDDFVVAGYNQFDEYLLFRKSAIARISHGQAQTIFNSRERLSGLSIDKHGSIYLSLDDELAHYAGEDYRSFLVKISNSGEMLWRYKLKGSAHFIPVVWDNSIVIFDFIKDNRSGRLNRISQDGQLIWEKPFQGFIWSEPLVLNNNKEMLVGFRIINKMFKISLNGEILLQKNVKDAGQIPFYQAENGDLFGCLHRSIVALDEGLNILWEYIPTYGVLDPAPVADLSGNLYAMMAGYWLLSLDAQGKKRWMAKTFGMHRTQPLVLEDGNILSISSEEFKAKPGKEKNLTLLEIFSPEGIRLYTHEVPGWVDHASLQNSMLSLATVNEYYDSGKDVVLRSIKAYSLEYSP